MHGSGINVIVTSSPALLFCGYMTVCTGHPPQKKIHPFLSESQQTLKTDKLTLFIIIYHTYRQLHRSWDSSVGIATGYGLDDRGVGVRVPEGSKIFSSPRRPDRLWDRGVTLTTHHKLLPRSRKCGSIHPLPHTPIWRSV
jgi:hypothetical protein